MPVHHSPASPLRRFANLALVPLVALLASACSGTGGTSPGYTEVAYTCERGAPISVRYFEGQEVAELIRGDDVLRLAQQPTGSGFHYTDGRMGIRGKGDELLLEVGRMAPIPCKAR